MYSFPVVSHELIVTNSIVDDVEAKSDPNNVFISFYINYCTSSDQTHETD